MAVYQQGIDITVQAGGDLSSHQYKFVTMASDGQVDLTASAGGTALGILQNKPDAAGKAAVVRIFGGSKLELGATITPDDKLQSTAAGVGDVAASGDHVLAQALEGGASGEVIEVVVGLSAHILA
jgi:hypothetical protein